MGPTGAREVDHRLRHVPHTWIVVAGIAFDTSATGQTVAGEPAGSGPRWRPDPTGNLADGFRYVQRHPAGL